MHTPEIKSTFKILEKHRQDIGKLFNQLNERKMSLQTIHQDLLTLNNTKLFVFGLDSLQFQKQMIGLETNSMETIHKVIENRLYGDLFKLHQLILDFIQSTKHTRILIKDKHESQYPQYMDTDIYHRFNFKLSKGLFNEILELIQVLEKFTTNLEEELDTYEQRQQSGLNIDNFIFAFDNCKNEYLNKTKLFYKYLDYLVNLHVGYMEKFKKKLEIIFEQITSDIQFECEKLKSTKPPSTQPIQPTQPTEEIRISPVPKKEASSPNQKKADTTKKFIKTHGNPSKNTDTIVNTSVNTNKTANQDIKQDTSNPFH